MGYSYGFVNGRDVGYGVPAVCDQPDCEKEIDRGLGYVCGGDIAGGDNGCGLFFCEKHLVYTEGEDEFGELQHSPQLCENCAYNFELGSDRWREFKKTFDVKPDVQEWVNWKLTDDSWKVWRKKNPTEVKELRELLSLNPKKEDK